MSTPPEPTTSSAPDKPLVSVATIGHHGDGKTTLTAALTRVLAQRPGCVAKPQTVEVLDRRDDPTFVEHYKTFPKGTVLPTKLTYETPSRRVAHIDCSGRRGRVRSTATLLGSVDTVVIVVSAVVGARAQTLELVRLAAAAGVRQAIAFINKCDLAEDPELLDVIETEIRELVTDVGLDGDEMPVIRGAAKPALELDPTWQTSIQALIEVLDHDLHIHPVDPSPPVVMSLDVLHRNHPPGQPRRVLVEGTVRHGTIEKGQHLVLQGSRIESPIVVRSIESFHQKLDRAGAGEHIGVMLEGLTKKFDRRRLRKGDLLLSEPQKILHQRFRARLRLLHGRQGGRTTPCFSGDEALFFLGSATAVGRIEMIPYSLGAMPGTEVEAEITLQHHVYLHEGMPFALRDGCDGFAHASGGPPTWSGTAGTGEVVEILRDSLPKT
ncbi:MAG: GTP-binding protein [Nannocystaceae bacterium]